MSTAWAGNFSNQNSLDARTLLGVPGRTTGDKKLLGAPGIATRSKDATRGSKCFRIRVLQWPHSWPSRTAWVCQCAVWMRENEPGRVQAETVQIFRCSQRTVRELMRSVAQVKDLSDLTVKVSDKCLQGQRTAANDWQRWAR